MKLNLGSAVPRGKYSRRPWVNVDYCRNFSKIRKNRSNIIIGSGLNLPFKDSTFDEIHLIHVLEHVPVREHQNFIKECYRVLSLGGILYVEVPDFLATCFRILIYNEKIKRDPENAEFYEEVLRCAILSVYGKNRYPGDSHQWGFTDRKLKKLLEEVGFKAKREVDMISPHHEQEPVLLFKGSK